MALTDDQKAMLRLLAQREEGYEDMAALMGISVEEVRERVKEALAEVDEPSRARPSPSAARAAPPPPRRAARAGAAAAPPAAEPTPAPPPSRQPAPPRPRSPPRQEAPGPDPEPRSCPKDRGALIGLGAGALVVVAS